MAVPTSSTATLPVGWSEHSMKNDERKLPFFVYGTLQTGFQNHDNFVRGRFTSIHAASIGNATLRHYTAGFPGVYICSDSSARVVGQLITPPVEVYAQLMRDLDSLEDYKLNCPSNMYKRVVCLARVEPPDGSPPYSVEAWMYVSLLPDSIGGAPVPSGDWRAWMTTNGLKDTADDWAEKLGTF
jgi:gamma-glutamylcyclotransferase (GGCT)/AIG2-like uncharacterized protein YtfP